jgi:hypothetical protein
VSASSQFSSVGSRLACALFVRSQTQAKRLDEFVLLLPDLIQAPLTSSFPTLTAASLASDRLVSAQMLLVQSVKD